MNRSTAISLFLGILISVAALYMAFRNIPFDDLLMYLSSINYLWVIPSAVVGLSSFIFRALRWQAILKPVREVSFMQAFHPLMTGFMLNCILPGRIGEAARPAILMKNEKIPFSTGFATIAVDRLFDVVFMLLLFSIISSTIDIDKNFSVQFGNYRLNKDLFHSAGRNMAGMGIFLIACIFILSMDKTGKILVGIITKLPDIFFFTGSSFKNRVKNSISSPAKRILENFSNGLLLIKSPRTILVSSCYTLAVWILTSVSYYLLTLGCPGIELSFAEITTVMIIVCFFIILPSAPGYWGLWEAGGVFAMTLFGISAENAAGFTLTNHVIQMVPVIITGLVSAVITGVNIKYLSNTSGNIKGGV